MKKCASVKQRALHIRVKSVQTWKKVRRMFRGTRRRMRQRHHKAQHLLLRTLLQSRCSGARAARVVGVASLLAEGCDQIAPAGPYDASTCSGRRRGIGGEGDWVASVEGIGSVAASMSGKYDKLHLACAPDPACPPSQPPELALPTLDWTKGPPFWRRGAPRESGGREARLGD
jgi:hypothetical protein